MQVLSFEFLEFLRRGCLSARRCIVKIKNSRVNLLTTITYAVV
jgi:hypothetical protein